MFTHTTKIHEVEDRVIVKSNFDNWYRTSFDDKDFANYPNLREALEGMTTWKYEVNGKLHCYHYNKADELVMEQKIQWQRDR